MVTTGVASILIVLPGMADVVVAPFYFSLYFSAGIKNLERKYPDAPKSACRSVWLSAWQLLQDRYEAQGQQVLSIPQLVWSSLHQE
jgi:hypothetical protein